MALAPGISTAALVDIVGGSHVCFDLAVRRRFGCGFSDLFSAVPDVVVFPASTGEVSELMRDARASGVPIAHHCAARSPAGTMALGAGGIVLSLKRMNRIIDVDLADGIARIQPTSPARRFDPPQDSTGQIRPSRQLMLSAVTSLRAVRSWVWKRCCPPGEIVRTGGSLLARDLGERELAALLAGPDGTLAVITELTVALDSSRAYPYVALAYFPSVAAACAAARTVMISERTPPRLNFLDRPTVGRVEDSARLGLRRDGPAVLVSPARIRSTECREQLYRVGRICMDAGARDSCVAEDPAWCATLLRTLAQTGADDRFDPALPPAAGPLVSVPPDRVASEARFGE